MVYFTWHYKAPQFVVSYSCLISGFISSSELGQSYFEQHYNHPLVFFSLFTTCSSKFCISSTLLLVFFFFVSGRVYTFSICTAVLSFRLPSTYCIFKQSVSKTNVFFYFLRFFVSSFSHKYLIWMQEYHIHRIHTVVHSECFQDAKLWQFEATLKTNI